MEINFIPREMPSTIKDGHCLVEVNGTPIGFIEPQWQGAKTIWTGYIGSTRVFSLVKSKKAAHAEMVKHISEIHRKFTRKGSNLDQSRNPLKTAPQEMWDITKINKS